MAALVKNKTQPTDASVESFLAAVEPATRREDARAMCALMSRLSGHPPRMWGTSIIGFGRYHYRYDSGWEGDAPLVGLSPRKAALTLYLMGLYIEGAIPRQDELLARLGPHKRGKACLYLSKVSEIDLAALEGLIAGSLAHMRDRYPAIP